MEAGHWSTVGQPYGESNAGSVLGPEFDPVARIAWRIAPMSLSSVHWVPIQASIQLPRVSLWFSVAAVFAICWIGGQPMLGASPRTFVLAAGAMVGLVWFVSQAGARVRSVTTKFVAIYLLYVVWASLAYVWHGMPIPWLVKKVCSTHLLALLTFFTLLPAATVPRYRRVLLAVLGFAILVSGALAFLQWLNFGWAWELAVFLNPRFQPLWGTTVPGLSMNSVGLAYQLLVCTPFVLVAMALRGPYGNGRTLVALLAALVPVFAMALQSRSLVLSLWSIPIVLFWMSRGQLLRKWVVIPFLFTLVLTTVAVTSKGVALIDTILAPAWLNPSLRYDPNEGEGTDNGYLRDSINIRLHAAETLIRATEDPMDAVMGPGPIKYQNTLNSEVSHVYPHNVFLNAYLICGLIGVALMLWLHAEIVLWIARMRGSIRSGVFAAAAAALFALFLQTLTHNESFALGSYHPWICLAIAIGCLEEST